MKLTRFYANQEIPRILWNPKVHYRTHKRPPPVISSGPRLTVWIFRNMITFLRWGVVSASPNPQAGGPPFVGCPQLLIQYIHCYPPYWRPFLHPQPGDAPHRGDRDPLVTALNLSPFRESVEETEVWLKSDKKNGNKLHLFRRKQHSLFIYLFSLNTCLYSYTLRPVLRPTLVMPIKKSYNGRHNNKI